MKFQFSRQNTSGAIVFSEEMMEESYLIAIVQVAHPVTVMKGNLHCVVGGRTNLTDESCCAEL